MAEQQDRILGYFLEEANQHLQTIEQGLLKLPDTVKNPAATKELFRAAHSIKGSAAMLGLFAIQQSSRELEAVFKVLKEQPIKVDNQLQTLCFQCYGLLQSAVGELDGSIDASNSDIDRNESGYGEIFDRLKQHLTQLQSETEIVPNNELEITPEVGLTIEQVFGEYVSRKLGEINQLCQQADSPETRLEVQAICRKLGSLGDDFEFLEWTHLLSACRLAVANTSVPIDRLNGAVQLSIKRGQSAILEHRVAEIEVTPELQTLIVADSHSSSRSIDAPANDLTPAPIDVADSDSSSRSIDAPANDLAPTPIYPAAIIYEPIESSLDLDNNAIAFLDEVSFDEELSDALSDSFDLFDNHALLADGAIGTDNPSQLDLTSPAEDVPHAFLSAPVDFFEGDSNNPSDLPASDVMWATNASTDNDVNLWSDDVFGATDIDEPSAAAFAFSDVDLPQPHDFDLNIDRLPAPEFSPEFSLDVAEDEVFGYVNGADPNGADLTAAESFELVDGTSNDLDLEPLANLPALETLDPIEQSAIDTIDQLALDTAGIGTIDPQDLIGDNNLPLTEVAALDLPPVDNVNLDNVNLDNGNLDNANLDNANLDLADVGNEAEEDPAWSDDLMGMHDRQSLVGEAKFAAIDDIGSFDFAPDESGFESVGAIDLEDPFDFALGEDNAAFAAASPLDLGDPFGEDMLPTAGDFDAADLLDSNSDIDLAAANGSLFDDNLVLPTAGDFDFGNDSSLDLSTGLDLPASENSAPSIDFDDDIPTSDLMGSFSSSLDLPEQEEFEAIGTIDLMDDLSVGLDLPAADDIASHDLVGGDEFEAIGTIDLIDDLSVGLDLPAADDITSHDLLGGDEFEAIGTIDLMDDLSVGLDLPAADDITSHDLVGGDEFEAIGTIDLIDDLSVGLDLPAADDITSHDLLGGDEFEAIGTIDLIDDLSVGLDLPAADDIASHDLLGGDEFEAIGTIDLIDDLSVGLDLPLDLAQTPSIEENNDSGELQAAAANLQLADLHAAASIDESLAIFDEGTFFQDYDEDLDISGNLLSGILGKEPTSSTNTISDEPTGVFATSLDGNAVAIELPDFEMSYDIDVESTGFALDEMRASDLSNSLENEGSKESDLDSLDLNSIDLSETNGFNNLDLNSIDLSETNGFNNLDLNSIDLSETSTLDDLDLDNLDDIAATSGNFEHLDGLLAGAGILGGVGAIAALSQMNDLDNLLGAPAPTNNLGDLDNLLGDSTPAPAKPEKAAKATTDRKSKQRTFEETMRVSVKNLNNLNNLVGELVVNRNTLEQDQNRMRQFIEKLLSEVQRLNEVGKRMQDLYERSLMENSLQASKQQKTGELSNSNNLHLQQLNAANSNGGEEGNQIEYDPLEMDRFTPIHLLSQKMIELTVRIRESTADIEFVVDGSTEVTRTLRQITNQVQEDLTKTRMNPFSQTADRLQRGVRDNGLKYGKQVNLDVDGRDTQIDKVILEKLTDPLIHMVNNSIAHGIETPEERMAKGKPAEGKITIRALHQGNQTIVSVADDGAGIDTERVKAKALEKGIITVRQAASMTKQEVYELLFLPSFSTKDQADELAGRGVGMDVVMKSLQDIRGTITTESQLGVGTTFTIRLPLALSITKALIAVNNKTSIAFPMDGIEDTQDMHSDQIQLNNEGEPCIFWRDRLMPFKRLSELLGYNRPLARSNFYGSMEDDEDITSILIVRSDSNFIAVSVDKILNEQEIVIKPLQGPANKPLGIAGATVMGDGRIVPIADAIELVDLARGTLKLNKPQVAGFVSAEPAIERHEPMVLIVDDSITVRELLSLTFKRAGYRVEQARDGQEAWDKLRAGLPCDIVFCDIEMPRMDGLELLSRIQKDIALSKVPVAMLTSRGSDRHRQIASQLGASGYFIKPYLEEALLDAAKRMIKGEVLAIV